jgi:iron(III) transport system ATP-binding protein
MGSRITAPVRLEHLTKRFGAITAVADVSFQVPAGKLVCLLGPSGCGKTTTLRLIGGFEEPTAGHILIGEQRVENLPPYHRPTAMVFQSYALFPHMSVSENVAYGLQSQHVPRNEIATRVKAMLELMELGGLEKKFPRQLSGGQQQRVALARALVIEPKVLLFDEPLSNLDAQLRVRVRGEIRSIQRKLGITAIYVTHDQEEAFSLSDLTAVMQSGKLVQVGRPIDIYRQPANEFVAHFVGLSNIVPVDVIEANAQRARVNVLGRAVDVPGSAGVSGERAAIVLRPEMLRLAAPNGDGVPARVKTIAFLGPLIRYVVVTDRDLDLTVDVTNPSLAQVFSEGAPVTVQLPAEASGLLAV